MTSTRKMSSSPSLPSWSSSVGGNQHQNQHGKQRKGRIGIGTINNTSFRPTSGLDTIGKQHTITLQTITAMPEYEQYSIEELRLHDMMTMNAVVSSSVPAAVVVAATATSTAASISISTSISSSFTSPTKGSKSNKATPLKVDDITSKISSPAFSISSKGKRKTGAGSSTTTATTTTSASRSSSSQKTGTRSGNVSLSVGASVGDTTPASSAAHAGTAATQRTKQTKKYMKLSVAESKRRAYERHLREKAKKEQKVANQKNKPSQPTLSVSQNGPGRCRPRTSDSSSTNIQTKKPCVDGLGIGKSTPTRNSHHQSPSKPTTSSTIASAQLKSPPPAAKTAPVASTPQQPHQTVSATVPIPSVVPVQQQSIPSKNSSQNASGAVMPSMMDVDMDGVVVQQNAASSVAGLSSPTAQSQHARDPNLDTPAGKATLLLQAICKAARNLPNSPTLNLRIVAEDSLWTMWEHLLTLQERLQKDGGCLYAVDIGFHYTSPESIEKIKLTGLMTKSERQSTGINQTIFHGNSYGDGVYTGNSPVAFQRYGSCGIIVARLKGTCSPRSRYFPNVAALKFNTVIGNKDIEKDPNGYYDEVVLRNRSQVVPLIRFNKAAIDNDNPRGISHTIDHDLSLVYYAAEKLQRIISGICNQSGQKINRIFYDEFVNARVNIFSPVAASAQNKTSATPRKANIPARARTQGFQVNLPPQSAQQNQVKPPTSTQHKQHRQQQQQAQQPIAMNQSNSSARMPGSQMKPPLQSAQRNQIKSPILQTNPVQAQSSQI